MIPWEILDSTKVPGGSAEICLYSRGKEFSIRINGCELMNSRVHGSEDALAQIACTHICTVPSPQILIGGLGMGFTVAAALQRLGAEGRVLVAELVPKVVEWNRKLLGALNGHPLQDPRVTVQETDVALILKSCHQAFNAILLDVDNGPEGLTSTGNNWLYTEAGVKAAFASLKPGGVLAVWSAGPDPAFAGQMRRNGFQVEEFGVRARGRAGGALHTIWVALRR
jgi:spermidine synthase